MKTIRRRAASPVLRWDAAGPNHQYRVIVRNQDTGERRPVYDGFRTECRLPPDFRLTPDQLAFRVMIRPAGDADAKFTKLHEYAPIPRLGDELETPADDLLVGEVIKGADQYRLLIKRPDVDRPLVDMTGTEPRFLLPPGQLRDGAFEYDILPRVRGRWRNRKGLAVTPAMIAAADARAERLVTLPPDETKIIRGAPARHAPGRPDRLAPGASSRGSSLLIAVDVTARPDLSPVADPRDVAHRQWWAGDGSGAVERVALALESTRFKGLFLIDTLASEALGAELVRDIADILTKRGHGLGLLINPEPWRTLSGKLAEIDSAAATSLAYARYTSIMGQEPVVAGFGPDALDILALEAARALGVRVVLADRAEQLNLPAWMRWRTAPFAAYDDMLFIPTGVALSTPAHARDRVVRHALNAADAMAAEAAAELLEAAARGAKGLLTARIEPLSLLRRSMVRSGAEADAWNQVISEKLPAWSEAGWERSPHGFSVMADRDEIKVEMMMSLIAGLARAKDVGGVDPGSAFEASQLRSWAEQVQAFEPLVEQRRRPRRFRNSAVRRYDAAYLQALKANPA